MHYPTLTLGEITIALEDAARQAADSFGGLDAGQINWRPDAARWSVAQCLEHLLTANGLMRAAADEVMKTGAAPSLWQRLPVWPGLMGRMLIRSQAPDATRKFKAPRIAQPSASDVSADLTQRFVEQHQAMAEWVRALDEARAARVVMTSPFLRAITYSVLDGCRVIVAHDHRHVQQARRVMQEPGFPRG
jgi:hypothetical protein